MKTKLITIGKGIAFTLLVVWGAFCTIFFLLPVVALVPFHYVKVIRWRRRWGDFIVGIYFDFIVSLVTLLGGTKIYLYSDSEEILKDRGSLLLTNQRSKLDWLYSGLCYSALTSRSCELKMVTREFLKSIPVFGSALQIILFIFLRRNREFDIPHMIKQITYLIHAYGGGGNSNSSSDNDYSYEASPSILLFPEETDLSYRNIEKSNAFARSKGLTEWYQVLQPKAAGMHACIQCMRGAQRAVHDITIAVKEKQLKKNQIHANELSVLGGMFPEEIHLIVKRYSLDDLPMEEIGVQKWLRERYQEKEDILTLFYTQGVKEGMIIPHVKGDITPSTILSRTNSGTTTPASTLVSAAAAAEPDSAGIKVKRTKSNKKITRSQSNDSASSSNYNSDTDTSTKHDNNNTSGNTGMSSNHTSTKNHHQQKFIKWPKLLLTNTTFDKYSVMIVCSWMAFITLFLATSSIFRWVYTCMLVTYASFRAVEGFDHLELFLHGDMLISEGFAAQVNGSPRWENYHNLVTNCTTNGNNNNNGNTNNPLHKHGSNSNNTSSNNILHNKSIIDSVRIINTTNTRTTVNYS